MTKAAVCAAVAVSLVSASVLFELLRPRGLSYDGLWAARLGLVGTVLLALNLVGVLWYAFIARDQTDTLRRQVAIEQTPILIVESRSVRNIGRGPALSAFVCITETPDTIGIVEPGSSAIRLPIDDLVMLGFSDHRLYYQDARGAWYCTKIIAHGGALHCKFFGEVKDQDVPARVRALIPLISIAEQARLH